MIGGARMRGKVEGGAQEGESADRGVVNPPIDAHAG